MNPIRERVAANIKLAREEKKMSRPVLAKVLECHTNTVYQWETGERECPTDKLKLVADALRDGNWLWFYNNEPKPAVAEATVVDEKKFQLLLEMVNSLAQNVAELKQQGGDKGLTKCFELQARSSDDLVNLLLERAAPQAQEMLTQQKAS